MRGIAALILGACLMAGAARAEPADPEQALTACLQNEDPDIGIQSCTAALARKDLSANGQRMLYERRGAAYYQKNEADQALADYDTAVKLDPKSDSALGGRGISYYAKGDCARAIPDLTAALDINPKHVFAHAIRGVCYVQTGKFKEAIDDLSINLDPTVPGAAMTYYYRAAAYDGIGETAKAKADLDQCLKLEPGQSSCTKALEEIEDRKGTP